LGKNCKGGRSYIRTQIANPSELHSVGAPEGIPVNEFGQTNWKEKTLGQEKGGGGGRLIADADSKFTSNSNAHRIAQAETSGEELVGENGKQTSTSVKGGCI